MRTRKENFNYVACTGSQIIEPARMTRKLTRSSITVGGEESSLMDLRALSKAGRLKEALLRLDFMDDRGIHATVEDYASLLQGCVTMKDLDMGKQVHSCIVQSNLKSTLVLQNALVNTYCKCGSLADACNLFDTMLERDVFTWTTMIAGYAIHGPPENAFQLFWNMEGQNIKPDDVTFLSIIKACARLKNLEHGKRLHDHIKKSGINENILIRSSLVDMYAKCGSIECALQEFEEMPKRDAVTWNAMISGYAQNGRFENVLNLFLQMMGERFKPDRITLSNVLKACASLQMLKHGKWTHNYIIKQKLEADVFVGSTLVDMYAKCGSIKDAWQVFNKMPRRTEVSWNAMIIGYAQPGYSEKSLKLFWQMESANVKRSMITYVGALKACAVLGVLEEGKWIHESFAKSGMRANLILRNTLVDMYAKCGSVKEARQAFDGMPERDVISWNALIAGYAQHGPVEEAFELFHKMEREGVQPDRVTFLSVLKACTSLSALEQGKQIHAHVRRAGFDSDIFVASTLLDMYAKCGSVEEAREIFDEMQERNEVPWNSLIAGYVQHGHLDHAFNLFQKMEDSGIKPGKVTFLSILKACANLGDLELGKHIHNVIVTSGFETDNFIRNSLVDMYAKCGDVDNAHHVFDGLGVRNLVSWNALISGYVQQDQTGVALELFEKMEQENIEPNEVTFITAIKACANPAHLDHGKNIHSHVVQSGFESFLYVGNSLIDMYSKCKSVKDARRVFDLMHREDLVTWNAMIAGYSSSGMNEEAFKLFWQMGSQGLQPDEVTFLSLLKACAGLGSLKQGKEIHALIKRNGLQLNSFIGNALIDMYAKCGSCEEAHDVFNSLSQREVVSWNAIITGYLQHGHAKEALNLFQEMKEECLEPDRVTFLNTLKACGSLGYLDQAKQIHTFAEKQGVEFDLFLRNTLIDMYGKCGDVKAARQVFDDMEERDIISWNALITGYAQNGHVQETFECVHRMQVEGQKLDHITFVTVLSVCNHAGLVDEGHCNFDALSSIHGINHTQEHYACMVDILCRAGRLQEAMEFIEKMPFHPGAVVWMALLGGCRLRNNLLLAIHVADNIFELQPQNTAPYVLLSNICAVLAGWECNHKVRKVMKDRNARTEIGHFSTDVNDQAHGFYVEDASSCKLEAIHSELHRLYDKLEVVGYIPDTCFILHDGE